ncbi:MAG: hypothetical protein WBN96_00590, partial [Gammaproteobacteria bacterium]
MMITLNQIIRSRAGTLVAAAALVLNLSIAHALPVGVDISGDNLFDDVNSFNGTGSFFITSGGTTTTSSYDDTSAVTGANPLSGNLTQVFDGFGFDGAASITDDEFLIGFDTTINVANNSLAIQTIEFRLDFSNLVSATGADAYADSELVLQQKLPGEFSFTEIFFSDLVSDSFNGDTFNGNATGTMGVQQSDMGVFFFSLLLNPAEQADLRLIWTLNGGDYAGGLAEAELNASLKV